MEATELSVLLVGCGNMGQALLKGCLSLSRPVRVHVVEPADGLRDKAVELGASASAELTVPDQFMPEVILLAVKPHLTAAILAECREYLAAGAVALSVAAGVTIATMQDKAGKDAGIIRCMPNTPSQIGAGALVCCKSSSTTDAQVELATQLLSTCGKVHFVDDESLMDAVTAISGSGPAYVFHFIECLAEAGKAAGLPAELASELALQTVYGAGKLARESDVGAQELRRQVTSPNGTTAAALDVLMAPDALAPLVVRAAEAARDRSIELGQAG